MGNRNMDTLEVSIIVSTYNWPQALEKCLLSIFQQSQLPKEIVIADDGSKPHTKEMVSSLQRLSSVPIVHIWHADEGFRLSAIRNKAIAAAKGNYIIQIDGDIILHKDFIADHLALAQPKTFLCGSRVLLPQKYSANILKAPELPRIKKSALPLASILNSYRFIPLSHFLADRYKKNKPLSIRGCNMSFWKQDLVEVNGYNESIQGWGSEDAELTIRLLNAGKKKRFIKFGAVAYHIYHEENSRSNLRKNEEILSQAISKKLTWIEDGIYTAI